MAITIEQLHVWMRSDEDEHLEFKTARDGYDSEKLVKYCVALANERGGKFILGVTNNKPRRIEGTNAFPNLDKTRQMLWDKLQMRIDATELLLSQGRIVVFEVPSRPIGRAVAYDGSYWMRIGESLRAMSFDQLMKIAKEAEPDFSAEVCRSATIADLDATAIEQFRMLWLQKSGNTALLSILPEQLLTDAELLVDGGVSYSALILFGSPAGLGRHLAQAEVIFEYRSSDASVPTQQRVEFRKGFFSFYQELWELINLRNDIQHFQSGLFIWDISTFNEMAVREALLNAVSHREYRLHGSVFIRQYPRKLEITSPGGLPLGVTVENILNRQSPRNRRIAEAFSKCGLVERSGQGVNRMFEEAIRESKPTPSFTGTDDFQVVVTLHGDVQDPQFLRFLEQIGKERVSSFTTQDFLVLDYIHHELPLPENLKQYTHHLIEEGVIERKGHRKYMLSRRFYKFIGQKGVYTRKQGLDRETNKMLLLKHITDNAREGSRIDELAQVLPSLSVYVIKRLLYNLKEQGKIRSEGITKGTRWYPILVNPTARKCDLCSIRAQIPLKYRSNTAQIPLKYRLNTAQIAQIPLTTSSPLCLNSASLLPRIPRTTPALR